MSTYGDLSNEQLAVHAQGGDRVAANLLMERCEWVVRKLTRQYASYMNPQDVSDLVQEARIGLMTAYAKFDVERGFKFTTYAMYWVRQKVQRKAWGDKRKRMASLNAPVGEDSDTTVMDTVPDPRSMDGFDAFEESAILKEGKSALRWLTPREARVLELRFGMERNPSTLDDDVMARIKAIEAKARRGLAA